MFLDWVYLIVGLLLIIAGGNYLTDGSVAIARRFKISEIVIGLTIVAIGSSTPDLVVALMSTIEHKSALAVGDIVGANIFDWRDRSMLGQHGSHKTVPRSAF